MKRLNSVMALFLAAVVALSPVCTSISRAEETAGSVASEKSTDSGEKSSDSSNEGSSGDSSQEASVQGEGTNSGEGTSSAEAPAQGEGPSSGEASGQGSDQGEGTSSAEVTSQGEGPSSAEAPAQVEGTNPGEGSVQADAGTVGETSVSEEDTTAKESAGDAVAGGSLELYNTVGSSTYNFLGGTINNNANISESFENVNTEGLSVYLRGVKEEYRKETFDVINQYIGMILESGKNLNIKNPAFIDAEKYKFKGYDSNHCWAATSANILWTTGYAQKAINPMTGRRFTSEDEVLTYFTTNFTDLPGCPEDGINWFFEGTSGYEELSGVKGVAQIKGDDNPAGLLPKDSPMAFLYNILDDVTDRMNALYSIASNGIGVLVRWFDNSTDTGLTEGAHWATVNGVIFDEKETDITKSIKAIVLADSDNTPVNGILTADSYISDVLDAKRAQPNIYSIYKVVYEGGYWLIKNYGGDSAVITYLYGLMDSDKSPEGEGFDNISSKDAIGSPLDITDKNDGVTVEIKKAVKDLNDSGIKGKDGEEIYIVVEKSNIEPDKNTRSVARELSALRSLTESDFDELENIEALLAYMIHNISPVFVMNNGVVEAQKDCVCFISVADTKLHNLMVDGKLIPADAYRIVPTKNGIAKLVISKDYLAKLAKGLHEVKISVLDSEFTAGFGIILL